MIATAIKRNISVTISRSIFKPFVVVGFEPLILELRVECSTTVLAGHKVYYTRVLFFLLPHRQLSGVQLWGGVEHVGGSFFKSV